MIGGWFSLLKFLKLVMGSMSFGLGPTERRKYNEFWRTGIYVRGDGLQREGRHQRTILFTMWICCTPSPKWDVRKLRDAPPIAPGGPWRILRNISELFAIRVKVSLINLFHPPSTRYAITRPQRSNFNIARSSSMAILGTWLFWESPLACNLGVLFSSSGVFLGFLLCLSALFGWLWLAFLLSEGFVFSGKYSLSTDLRPVHSKYFPE